MCDNYRIDVRGLETFLSREEWPKLENKPKALPEVTEAQGELDEVFASGAHVHIERMNETGFWMGIDCPGGKRINVNTGVAEGEWFFNVHEDWEGGKCYSVKRAVGRKRKGRD